MGACLLLTARNYLFPMSEEEKRLPGDNTGAGPGLRGEGATRGPTAFCEQASTQTQTPGALNCSGLKYLEEIYLTEKI